MAILIFYFRKFPTNILSKLELRKSLKFTRKHKIKLIFFFIAITIFLLFNSLTSTENIEKIIEHKIGIETKINDLQINFIKNEFSLLNFELSNS